jgi:glycosyltransferase involved in cell wall biosynthesis
MKIVLIAPTYLPALRANTIQVMKMAQAIASLGHNLTVLVPQVQVDRREFSWDDLAHQYGLSSEFNIEWLSTHPRMRSYDFGVKSVRRSRNLGVELIYTRLPQSAAIASMSGISTIYEIHDLPQGRMGPSMLRRFLKGDGARALILITTALRNAVEEKYGQSLNDGKRHPIPLIVEPDGVDLVRYQKILKPQQARCLLSKNIPLQPSSFLVGYTGHLYPGRGSEMILAMANQLPDVHFLLVGGEPADVKRVRQKVDDVGLKNITITGFIPNAEIAQYQAACDVLLMPYQRKVAASSGGDIAKYLSPMKLFEYMACGRPIISSDLPVLKEILNQENAILLPPEDLAAWVCAIKDLYKNPEKSAKLAAHAQKDVQKYSWESRAQNIISAVHGASESRKP